MDDWQWLLWLIPLAAVIGWAIRSSIVAAKGSGAGKEELTAISQRLDAIDARLTKVEKTLDDIP